MLLTAALLIVALAAPAHSGAPELPIGNAAVSVAEMVTGQTADRGERRPSRARALVTPPIRRLLRKRDLLAPVLPKGGGVHADPNLALLARAMDRSAVALLGRLRARPASWRVRVRLEHAGILTHALHRPPPSLPG